MNLKTSPIEFLVLFTEVKYNLGFWLACEGCSGLKSSVLGIVSKTNVQDPNVGTKETILCLLKFILFML